LDRARLSFERATETMVSPVQVLLVLQTRWNTMALELARKQAVPKPWGMSHCGPWMTAEHDGGSIGEIWYERPAASSSRDQTSSENSTDPALLLKLLFTSQPLSIQVHPDDTYARSKGLPNGKTEAWYVVQAAPGAAVAIGLDQKLASKELRQSVADGSIADRIVWQGVSAGDAVLVPAGTIHAIGAGLVIAEIQQRSDATYRLFDHGRQRELHIDDAIAVAETGSVQTLTEPTRLDRERTILACSPYFVFERLDFAPDQTWWMDADRETWLLVISGGAIAGSFGLAPGDAILAQSERVGIRVGRHGLVALAAYTGDSPVPALLTRSGPTGSVKGAGHETSLHLPRPASPTRTSVHLL
jgi:mannose-6-phosphate isomerase